MAMNRASGKGVYYELPFRFPDKSGPSPVSSGLSWNDARFALMSDSNRDGIFQRTKEALQLLACSPSVQFRLLPSFVRVGDELALDFYHWQAVMIDNFS